MSNAPRRRSHADTHTHTSTHYKTQAPGHSTHCGGSEESPALGRKPWKTARCCSALYYLLWEYSRRSVPHRGLTANGLLVLRRELLLKRGPRRARRNLYPNAGLASLPKLTWPTAKPVPESRPRGEPLGRGECAIMRPQPTTDAGGGRIRVLCSAARVRQPLSAQDGPVPGESGAARGGASSPGRGRRRCCP